MIAIAFITVLVLYVVITAAVTYGIVRFATTRGAKWALGVSSVFAFLALALWDEVWGYVQLRHLCATEGGIKVYKTVTLAPEHWNEDGLLKFSVTTKPFAGGRYEMRATGTTVLRWPNLVRSEYSVINRENSEKLATYTDFSVSRGWMLNVSGGHAGGSSCPRSFESIDVTLTSATFSKSSPSR